MNFENKNKFKIFPLRSLDTNRAEIRYRFRCSRTAPEIHLKFARRTVRVETFITDKRGFRNICDFIRKNIIYYHYKFLTWENVYCFVITFSFAVCILHIFHSDILKCSHYLQKISKPKQNIRDENKFPMPVSSPENKPIFWSLKKPNLKDSIRIWVLWSQNRSHILGSKTFPKFDALN